MRYNIGTLIRRSLLKKALFLRFGGIGDILMTTPVLRSFAEAFPGVDVDYIVAKGHAQVLTGLPYVRNVIEFDKERSSFQDMFRQIRTSLPKTQYDLFVNLHPSAKSILIGTAVKAAQTVVFVKDRHIQPSTGRVRHAIDDFYKHLLPIGLSPEYRRDLDFEVDERSRSVVVSKLVEHEVGPGTKLIVVNTAASRKVNRWPAGRFAQVCDHFCADRDCRVVLVGSIADLGTVSDVKFASNEPGATIDFCGSLSLKELGALLEHADVLLTCDTGPMHIGSAVGTPIVCLSGAADPDRTGPLGANCRVLIDRSLPCVSCQSKICKLADEPLCMSNITVHDVVAAIEELLAVATTAATRSRADQRVQAR